MTTRMADSNTSSFTSNASTSSKMDLPGSFLESSGPSFESTAPPVTGSPTSTIRSNRSNSNPPNPPQQQPPPPPMMAAVPLTMPSRTLPNAEPFLAKRRFVIRADPTVVSCFDPNDKELYDLWAPKP